MIGNIYMFAYRKVKNKDEYNIINKETKEIIETVTSKDDAQNKVTNLNLLKKRKFVKPKDDAQNKVTNLNLLKKRKFVKPKEKKVKVPKVKILKEPKSFATTPIEKKEKKVKVKSLKEPKSFATTPIEKKVKVPKVKILKEPKSFATTPIEVVKFKEQNLPLIKKIKSVLKEKLPKVPKEKVDKPKIVFKPALLAEINADKFKKSVKKEKDKLADEELRKFDEAKEEESKANIRKYAREFAKEKELAKQVSKEESKANIRKYAREFAKEKELAKPEPKYNSERAKERRDKAISKEKKALELQKVSTKKKIKDEKAEAKLADDETRKEKKALELQKVSTKKQLAKLAQQQAEAEETIKLLEDLKVENTKRDQKESLSKINSIIEEKAKAKEELKFITEKVKVKREKDKLKARSVIKEKPRPVKPNLKVNIPEKEKLQEKEMRIEELQMGQEEVKARSVIKEKPKRTPEEIARREAILAYNEKIGKEEEQKERMRQELEIQQVEIAKAKEKEDQERVKAAEKAIAAIAAKEEKEKVKKQDFYTKIYTKMDFNKFRSNIDGRAFTLKEIQDQGFDMYQGEGNKFYKESIVSPIKAPKTEKEREQQYIEKLIEKEKKGTLQGWERNKLETVRAEKSYQSKKRIEAKYRKEQKLIIKEKEEQKKRAIIKRQEKRQADAEQKEIIKEKEEQKKRAIIKQQADAKQKEIPKEVPKEYELSNRKRIIIDKDKVFYKGKEVGYFRKDKIYLNDMPASSDNKTLSLKDVTEIAPTVISKVVSQIEVPPESKPIVWVNPVVAPSPLVPFVPAPIVDTSDRASFAKYETRWGYWGNYDTIYIDYSTGEVYDANSKLVGERDLRQRSRLNVVGEVLDLEDYILS